MAAVLAELLRTCVSVCENCKWWCLCACAAFSQGTARVELSIDNWRGKKGEAALELLSCRFLRRIREKGRLSLFCLVSLSIAL